MSSGSNRARDVTHDHQAAVRRGGVVTFTKKAADEMRRRIVSLIDKAVR
jgi:ATP-dependent exoDNAse (exonuclease V) beta subunit